MTALIQNASWTISCLCVVYPSLHSFLIPAAHFVWFTLSLCAIINYEGKTAIYGLCLLRFRHFSHRIEVFKSTLCKIKMLNFRLKSVFYSMDNGLNAQFTTMNNTWFAVFIRIVKHFNGQMRHVIALERERERNILIRCASVISKYDRIWNLWLNWPLVAKWPYAMLSWCQKDPR